MLKYSIFTIQALVALSEVAQQLNAKNPDFVRVNSNEPIKIVLLSLGCGRLVPPGVAAGDAYFLPAVLWIPFVASGLATAAADMNEYHIASVFPDIPSSENYYLRVEVYEKLMYLIKKLYIYRAASIFSEALCRLIIV